MGGCSERKKILISCDSNGPWTENPLNTLPQNSILLSAPITWNRSRVTYISSELSYCRKTARCLGRRISLRAQTWGTHLCTFCNPIPASRALHSVLPCRASVRDSQRLNANTSAKSKPSCASCYTTRVQITRRQKLPQGKMVSISFAKTNDCFGPSTLREARSQRHLYGKRCGMSRMPRGREHNIHDFLLTLLPKNFSAAKKEVFWDHSSQDTVPLSGGIYPMLMAPDSRPRVRVGFGSVYNFHLCTVAPHRKFLPFRCKQNGVLTPLETRHDHKGEHPVSGVPSPISGIWWLSPDLPHQWALEECTATAVTASLQMSS